MNWSNPPATQWPSEPLKAKEHCCEEASTLSGQFYIPCNQPAVNIVGWKGRSDKPIRVCQFCSNHNVQNRGGEIISIYSSIAEQWKNPVPTDPRDSMNQDALLMLWQDKKNAIEKTKEEEIDLRKYIVKREFPVANEGMNSKDLGSGYTLKAGVKYNYNLADNDTVESTLEKLSNLGNAGSAISDRLVSWKPNFLLTEFRQLQEDKEKGSKFADEALKIISEMLTITDGAPTLEIKESRKAKR